MKRLYLVRGVPGSGKSTFAKSLGIDDHFEADMWFGDNGGFDHTKLKDAHEWCQSMTQSALCCGRDVVVSNTFIKRWELQPYIDCALRYGYVVFEVTCFGNHKSIHNVPDEVVQRMKVNFEP